MNEAEKLFYNSFSDLAQKTKLSLVGVLQTIVSVDQTPTADKKSDLVESHIKGLGLNIVDCAAHIKAYGGKGMLENLRVLSRHQKELMVVMAHNIVATGRPSEIDAQILSNIFTFIGISDQDFVDISNKAIVVTNHFLKR
jgi:uncharacterized tellurite resistance protein B-like protein